MSASTESTVHYRSEDASVASYGPFVLVRCFGDVPAEAVTASLEAHRAALVARPAGVVSVVVIDESTKFPSDEMRRASVTVRKATNKNVAASVTVVAGDGFWASTIRGALTAINSLAGSSYPTKVFRNLHEGVAWATGQAGTASPTTTMRLVQVIEGMKPG